MELFVARVNASLVPAIGLILMLINFRSNHNINPQIKRLMSNTLIFAILPLAFDLIHYAFIQNPARYAYYISWTTNTLYFVAQILTYGYLALLIDYYIYSDNNRLKHHKRILAVMFAGEMVCLTVNLFTQKIFYIDQSNFYYRGELYIILFLFAVSPAVMVLINIAASYKHATREIYQLAALSLIPTIIGYIADSLVEGLFLVWTLYFISLLFNYLFVIRVVMLTDSLTGIYNRRSCDEYVISLSRNRNKDYLFIMADLDKFKEINDTLGHSEGDNALMDAANILKGSVRKTDFVGRYGGDEFLIIAATDAKEVIEKKIYANFSDFNALKSRPYEILISLGMDIYKKDDRRTPLEFITIVDELMYEHKTAKKRRNT